MTIFRMKHAAAALVPLMVLFVLSAGCGKKSAEITPDLGSSDEGLYKMGELTVKKDREKGILYLRQVIDSFPKSFYAQRAKLLIADAYFRKGDDSNMILAAAEYREFIRTYPYSPSAAYSQYQVAMTFYKKILKPGRDQSKTIQALAEFKKVIVDYPASDQAKAAQEKVKDCEERLAGHNAEIAVGYCNRKAYRAAISRLTEIMTSYPQYSRLDEVYFYLGESHFLMNQFDQAVPFFTKVVTDYPRRTFVKAATKRLAEIEKRKAAQKVVPDKKGDHFSRTVVWHGDSEASRVLDDLRGTEKKRVREYFSLSVSVGGDIKLAGRIKVRAKTEIVPLSGVDGMASVGLI